METSKTEKVYHSTYTYNFANIKKDNFKESKNHEMWFGDGAYFFVDGIQENSINSARQYKIDDSKVREPAKVHLVRVIEAEITYNTDELLDLTNDEGVKQFNIARQDILDKIQMSGQSPIKDFEDYHVFNNLREHWGVKLVKGNVYIKFGIQRMLVEGEKAFYSRIPNVTIFVISNPDQYVSKASLKMSY